MITRSKTFTGLFWLWLVSPLLAQSPLPIVETEWQPFQAQVRRLIEALDFYGAPLSERAELESALQASDAKRVEKVQALLDRHCLFFVQINPEMRVKVQPGPAKPELDEQGWRSYLIKVHNQAGATSDLRIQSPNAGKLAGSPQSQVEQRWLEMEQLEKGALRKGLSGLELEYRLLQLYSRDSGKREARFSFDIGQGTQDLGFRSESDLLFDCRPAREISLRVSDEHGDPTTGTFVVRDMQGRVYPSMGKRLAPDFAFHPQIYREDKETIRLPDGNYEVEFSRGPESVTKKQKMTVGQGTKELAFQVERWIDPSKFGWWSGDHHIHAAGCSHYTKPSEGVHAPDMMRHCLGEDLKIGANLTWGPCFDYQKQFFTGAIDKVSRYPHLLRYDVEVSGFGSHQSGHLCLLRLKEQIYPGGDSTEHWPTLGLNTLRWAKKQGAVVGPAHSGWGLEVKTDQLPNYVIPPFSGIGANEYIVDVTHMVEGPGGKSVPAVDFISTVDTPYVWELNIWYHTLNCGFRTRISGETDFPCIYGERVGLGRSYVKVPGKLSYDEWCEGIRQGRTYVSDGKSHLIDFRVNGLEVGEKGSELRMDRPGKLKLQARVAARLDQTPNPRFAKLSYDQKPYWDLERSRIGQSRQVTLEAIVNGKPAAKQVVEADGQLRDLELSVPMERSGWVALRILPSSHTNPVFVLVDGKPIRASKRSAEWCLQSVDQCWSQKERFIKEKEKADALAAYDHARKTYRRILSEMVVD